MRPRQKSFVKLFINTVKEWAGVYPSSLDALLARDAGQKAKLTRVPLTIWWKDVVRWEELTKLGSRARPGAMKSWSFDKATGSWGEGALTDHDLAHLFLVEHHQDVRVDLRDVAGFTDSKARGEDLQTLKELIQTTNPRILPSLLRMTVEELLESAKHGIRYHGEPSTFHRAEWDGRIFVENNDASHRMAIAIDKAQRDGVLIELAGNLKTFGVNREALARLRARFSMLVVSSNEIHDMDLHKALVAFETPYSELQLPSPHVHARVLLLPMAHKRASKVAALFKRIGFQDFGEHLENTDMSQGLATGTQVVRTAQPHSRHVSES